MTGEKFEFTRKVETMKLTKTQRNLLAALIRHRRRAEATEHMEPNLNAAERIHRKSCIPGNCVAGKRIPGANILTWCALERAGRVEVVDGWWMATKRAK